MTDEQKLKDFRKNKNLTQQQLANILGLTQQTIAMVESGKRKAPDSLKLAILRKYKIDFDEKSKMTNYEKIKSLSLSEMTLFFVEIEKEFGVEDIDATGIREWLLSEVENDN